MALLDLLREGGSSLVLKKNSILYLKQLSLFLFMLLFVSSFTVCNASLEDYQLTRNQMQTIINTVGSTNVSGDAVLTFTETFNQWMRTMAARTGFDWVSYDIIFYSQVVL